MRVIGIAGGSGTGKSTIAAHIARRHGGIHIDADRVGHAVLDDPVVLAKVRERFGDDVVESDGRVNRRRLGARVFADDSARADLNAIVHPAIIRRCEDAVEAARVSGQPVAVVDAALLFEVDMGLVMDFTFALVCDPEVRLARLLAKGGWSEAEIRARLAAQTGLEKNFYKADLVVDTGQDLAGVLAGIDTHVDALLASESS